ncbi:MAG: CocE/NonD family hydrolase [Candidatus Aminicenantes bacterium]|jgi:putative CocE/NonD family hydrolase
MKRFILTVFLIFLFTFTFVSAAQKVSKPGQYSGYSQPLYDSWVRVSHYVTVQQGTAHETQLAIDLFFPSKDGKLFYEYSDANGEPVKLPAIWAQVPYHRANLLPDGSVLDWFQFVSPWLAELLKYGYVVGVSDIRGAGASYGTRLGIFSQPEANDAYDMIEWLASQPWCTGNIGMHGFSYMGINQFFAASKAPPHLKCIFPGMVMFDSYSFIYPGGVFQKSFVESWGFLTKMADLGLPPLPPAAPVDDDPYGIQLAEAINEHYGNADVFAMFNGVPYRDDIDVISGEQLHFTRSPNTYLMEINNAGIPVYCFVGWYDIFPRDSLQWFNNLYVPRKVAVGPWYHMEIDYEFFSTEHLRWYDYWLKGIDNGILAEPPLYYYTFNSEPGNEWRSTRKWPPCFTIKKRYYFHHGPTGTVNSINDGSLKKYPSLWGSDLYTVDYTTTTGYPTRWTNAWEGPGAPFGYPDMTFNDEKGLTYTSAPLNKDLRITGHPVVQLWISSTAADGDFFVYLEEVDETGYSKYITEGVLRASHRKRSHAPFNNMGLPWHRSFAQDISPLIPDKPVKLVFDLLPTSWIFKAGKRIRVTITGADNGNTFTPPFTPIPQVTLYRSILHSSYIKLPVIPGKN